MKIERVAACSVVGLLLCGATLLCGAASAAEWGLKEGTPDLKSAGPLAFGPDGILLVGDAQGATVFALQTGDAPGDPSKVNLSIEGLNEQAAKLLGASASEIRIEDLAVNPKSGNVYLSITNRSTSEPALLRIDATGKLAAISLKKIAFSKATLPNPPEDGATGQGRRRRNRRGDSITDLAYTDGKVLVSGLSNASSPSTVREIAFPFADADTGTPVEIYHGAHGRYEDSSPIRTFVPFTINGEPNLLAGFQCTPLVKFPITKLEPGKKFRGTTIAELGNRNRPLDMIVYKKDGKSFLLMANSSRGVMKISTEDIERSEGISERISGGGTAGQSYETIDDLEGVVQLDKLNDQHAVILVQTETGVQNLRTIPLP